MSRKGFSADRTTEERFFDFVQLGSFCWTWTGHLDHGYGRFWDGTRDVYAHRWIYERYRRLVPRKLTIDHLCRNRACVNPIHLEIVSNRVNVLRGTGVTAKNAAKTHCVHGHEYTPENTFHRRGTNWRGCYICIRQRSQRRHAGAVLAALESSHVE